MEATFNGDQGMLLLLCSRITAGKPEIICWVWIQNKIGHVKDMCLLTHCTISPLVPFNYRVGGPAIFKAGTVPEVLPRSRVRKYLFSSLHSVWLAHLGRIYGFKFQRVWSSFWLSVLNIVLCRCIESNSLQIDRREFRQHPRSPWHKMCPMILAGDYYWFVSFCTLPKCLYRQSWFHKLNRFRACALETKNWEHRHKHGTQWRSCTQCTQDPKSDR